MIRSRLCLNLFIIFAIAISILDLSSAEYLDEIEDDPEEGLFAEAVLQNHLNAKESIYSKVGTWKS